MGVVTLHVAGPILDQREDRDPAPSRSRLRRLGADDRRPLPTRAGRRVLPFGAGRVDGRLEIDLAAAKQRRDSGELVPERLQALQMLIDGPGPDRAPSGHRHPRADQAGAQGLSPDRDTGQLSLALLFRGQGIALAAGLTLAEAFEKEARPRWLN